MELLQLGVGKVQNDNYWRLLGYSPIYQGHCIQLWWLNSHCLMVEPASIHWWNASTYLSSLPLQQGTGQQDASLLPDPRRCVVQPQGVGRAEVWKTCFEYIHIYIPFGYLT